MRPITGGRLGCLRDPVDHLCPGRRTVAFVVARRRTVAGERPTSEGAEERALTEQEFADAEAYEAKWHEQDKERYHQERLP